MEGHSVGHVAAFGFIPDPAAVGEEKRLVLRAARRAMRQEMPRRVEALAAAPDAAFALAADGRVAWSGGAVARLRPGASLLRPAVEVLDSEFLDGAQRERVRVRVAACVTRHHRCRAGARAGAGGSRRRRRCAGRCTGWARRAGWRRALPLPPPLRARLKALGVRAGRFGLFSPAALRPRAMALRAMLWGVANRAAPPALPRAGHRVAAASGLAAGVRRAMGWVDAGPVLLRLDVAERIAAELAYATRRGQAALPPASPPACRCGPSCCPRCCARSAHGWCPAACWPRRSSARRRRPCWPAAPAGRRARARTAPVPAPVRPDGPFAALALLHRRP